MSLIKMTNITKSYGSQETATYALQNVSLSIQEGELVAIMGPSGSGKSTLLNMLGLLDRPTEGEYLLDNIPVQKLNNKELAIMRNKKIGFIFQNFSLLSEYTACENVQVPLFYRSLSKRECRDKALHALEAVGLKEHVNKRPFQLSGGQQQRVAIARALVGETPILLADEPTGALDQKTGNEIMELFKSIHEQGKSILIVTHDAKIAKECQRQIFIQDGAILANDFLAR